MYNSYHTGLQVDQGVDAAGILVVSATGVSSLPRTISNANIKSTDVVVDCVLSNPAAQTGNWTWTTSNGSISISGSISGSTNVTLYIGHQK